MLKSLLKNKVSSWIIGFAIFGACLWTTKLAIAFISLHYLLTTLDIITIAFIFAMPALYANLWLDDKCAELNPKVVK